MLNLPYNPTIVLPSPTSNGLLYIFRPAPGSGSTELVSVNTTATLDNDNVPFTTISPSLPFLKNPNNAYIPVIDSQGTILVFAGECGDLPGESGLWSLPQPGNGDPANAQWQQLKVSQSGTDDDGVLTGANKLASGLAFSTIVNSTSSVYIFGGMCPNSTDPTASTWTQAASYSNAMLSLQPGQASTSAASTQYRLGTTSSRGPPIPEAGFSMTALNPTFSSSGDNGSQSQNQNFVLVGGHTQTAFINMSQIALFSLPEESWIFLPVDLPDVHTDLMRRDTNTIDSRSGHTAILTSDGKSLVIYGGWVGDISQPADPQFAILELGAGYGGTGDWQWQIPSVSGPGPADGSGLYGHGATMLPGNVMMIVGGNSIAPGASTRRARQLPVASTSTLFLNVSSNTWLTSYKHPDFSQQHRPELKHTSNDAAKRAGLGAGLTLGVLIIIAAVVIYFWYSKRLKTKRDKREEDLRMLAAGAEKHLVSSHGRDRSIQEPETATLSQPEHVADPRSSIHSHRAEPQAERTGLLFEIPSPTRGLRRSLHSRGMYQPAPRFDNGRRTPDFLSTIHPIDERDEYEEDLNPSNTSGEEIHKRDFELLSNVPVLDPFRDPDRSRSPSPQSPQQRELEVRKWVDDWTAAEILMQQQAGRLSPEKTDRTSSTLSDQSARSLLSSVSWQPSAGTVSRTMSQRSAALFSGLPFRSTHEPAALEGPAINPPRTTTEHRRSNSWRLQTGAERSSETPTSFLTAQTSYAPKTDTSAAEDENSHTTLQGRARGFMGSLRRVLVGDRTASTSPEHSSSVSSSPTKSRYHDSETMPGDGGAGGAFWKARQGAKDWDADGQRNDQAAAHANEEWDVESAVQNRVVQVMFTVPKDKLRVVNRSDDDRESILSTKENSVAA